MQKWEYLQRNFRTYEKEIGDILNRLGDMCWECYSVTNDNSGDIVTYYLKRPIEKKPSRGD